MTQKMLHVSLEINDQDAPLAAYLLAKHGVFSPERSLMRGYASDNKLGQQYRDVYFTACAKLDRLAAHFGQLPEAASVSPPADAPSLQQLRETDALLAELLQIAQQCDASRARFEQEMNRDQALLAELEPFKALGVDLKQLAQPKRLIQTLVGTVPEDALAGLKDKLAPMGVVLEVFGHLRDRAYLVAICMQSQCQAARIVLTGQGWEEYVLPPEFLGRPPAVESELKSLCARITQRIEDLVDRHEHTYDGIADRLAYAVRTLELAEPYARLSPESVAEVSGEIVIRGWIPRRQSQRLRTVLDESLHHPFDLDLRPPEHEEREVVPSGPHYPDWLAPFVELVRGYGIPCYGDFDPTLFFTLSFTAMFGMMFGDVGHGLVIMLAAAFLRRGMKRFRPLVLATGAASALFGFVYGSVFGHEGIITPLWISPLADPLRMLHAALGWGVVFILATHLITIRNSIVARNWLAALFDSNGMAGLLLYLGGAASLFLAYTNRPNVMPAGLTALAGFLMVLFYNCSKLGQTSDRFLVSLMTSLESVFSDFIHTLSFMRVAAFSISHVALALAIYTLSSEMGTAGRIVTLAFGNIFILALEGCIVAIQVLRLEYYEGFSRYFTCFGREFKPMLQERAETERTSIE